MESKDYITPGLGALGWIWAITQFFLSRRNQKKDKALEKRFEVYSYFMYKADEINQAIRVNASETILKSINLADFLSENPEILSKVQKDFHKNVVEFLKESLKPTQILLYEISRLKLICSDEMVPLIDEFKIVSKQFSDESLASIENLSTNINPEYLSAHMDTLTQSNKYKHMANVWKKIENLMREEIGYYKK